MKIASSDIALGASHGATQTHSINENLHAWVDGKRADTAQGKAATDRNNTAQNNSSSKVQISDGARAAIGNDKKDGAKAAAAAAATSGAQAVDEGGSKDPVVTLIQQILEYFLGKKINVFDASALNEAITNSQQDGAPVQEKPSAGWGLEYDKTTTTTETEQSSFQASGVIQTEDGKELKFDLSVDLQHSYSSTDKVSVRAGDAKAVDPLVINFAGSSVSLSSQKFSFDLNADGKADNISFVQGGGFLALDKNGDGKINDGSELFGPATGNGFKELQALDSDGNGWIDENDPAFQNLQVWTKDSSGADKLTSLKDAGVGALYLGSAGTSFQFKDAQNNTQGQLRSSGVWISEDGQAGALQQIDLTV
ncbi:hypothetical protein ACO0LO_13920 [Undibacterium sp. TJN25]|uniref:hypothetical protein n=1 Tax=Undibacterium sp. TJN25 TaxID=3413056 RepID=UPI003BF2317F